jgi:S-adenosylmethionine:tRNA ribosyltransferase-isomerase
MDLSDFDYNLPEKLIAQYPLHRREKARLMIVEKDSGKISHDVFSRIGKYLPAGSMLVLNESKVVPARLLGKKERTGGQVEIFLLSKLSDGYSYETLMRPLRRIKNGDVIVFEKSKLNVEVVDREKRIVRFNRKNISSELDKIGHMPLPPYIKRPDGRDDKKYYQTVYAKKEGSVASPTAGLHFTKKILAQLKARGNKIEKVVLHINYATFKPVEERDVRKHRMHYEQYALTKKSHENMLRQKKAGRKIVAVGTTSCRVIETVEKNGKLEGQSNIFMYPGYDFKMTDALITNFHLPRSTLLMLVYALGGMELMKKAYAQAVKMKYRFFSYGDAMLII